MSPAADLPREVTDEPIIGWRTWFVLPDELLLRPVYMRGLARKPRQAPEAVCPEKIHAVPADGCKCGVWAVCHPMLLKETLWRTAPPDGVDPLPGVLVVGQIAMWGNVVQHDRGWRSSPGVAGPDGGVSGGGRRGPGGEHGAGPRASASSRPHQAPSGAPGCHTWS